MSFLDKLLSFGKRKDSASVAKERLQIIISHERSQRGGPDYLTDLQREIVDVVAKYLPIKKEDVKIQLDRVGGHAILELNITMPSKKLEEDAVV